MTWMGISAFPFLRLQPERKYLNTLVLTITCKMGFMILPSMVREMAQGLRVFPVVVSGSEFRSLYICNKLVMVLLSLSLSAARAGDKQIIGVC